MISQDITKWVNNMRSGESHLNWKPEQLLELFDAKLEKGRTYYHDCATGIIYSTKCPRTGDYIEPIIDVYKLTGKVHIEIPKRNGHIITSGLTKASLEHCMNKLDKEIAEEGIDLSQVNGDYR